MLTRLSVMSAAPTLPFLSRTRMSCPAFALTRPLSVLLTLVLGSLFSPNALAQQGPPPSPGSVLNEVGGTPDSDFLSDVNLLVDQINKAHPGLLDPSVHILPLSPGSSASHLGFSDWDTILLHPDLFGYSGLSKGDLTRALFVLLHEIGHCNAARAAGTATDPNAFGPGTACNQAEIQCFAISALCEVIGCQDCDVTDWPCWLRNKACVYFARQRNACARATAPNPPPIATSQCPGCGPNPPCPCTP
jgi:hypothetical protein